LRFDPGALAALVTAYAGHGIHRTGSPGDEATSHWLVDWLAERGIEAHTAAFPFPRVVVREAAVHAGTVRIEGTPLHDGGSTVPDGVTGVFRTLEDPDAGALAAALDAAGTAPGIIVVSGDPEGFPLLHNAERMDRPWRVPVLQVERRDAAPVLEAARSGAVLKLVVDFERRAGTATNVVADVPARGADGLAVLMTPKSGWFACAAERGGGIALALALAESAADLPRRKGLRVLFTGGHELGHCGLLAYLRQEPSLRKDARFWLQLGASIGARGATNMRVFTRDPAMREWFPSVLARHGAGPVALAPADLRPHGEAREVFDRPFLSLAGRHPRFHSPRDLPELALDAESLSRYGAAFRELLERLLTD
jgi:hypothetical protein